jgi:hypothetical protein
MCRTSTFLNDARGRLSLVDGLRSSIMATKECFSERYIYSSVRTAQRRGKFRCSRDELEGGVVCMDRGLTQSSFAGYAKPNTAKRTSLCVATVSSCDGRSQLKSSVGWHQGDVIIYKSLVRLAASMYDRRQFDVVVKLLRGCFGRFRIFFASGDNPSRLSNISMTCRSAIKFQRTNGIKKETSKGRIELNNMYKREI